MEDSGTIIQYILLVGGIFTGFFGLVKFIIGKFEKQYDRFMSYFEKKDAHIERISQKFTQAVEENQSIARDLSVKMNIMNQNDDRILKSIESNSHTLDRAVKVIELHEKHDLLKTVQKMGDATVEDKNNIINGVNSSE